MKILTDWGFTRDGWRGGKGEYWVLGQVLLVLVFFELPAYQPAEWVPAAPQVYLIWAIAATLGLLAVGLLLRGLIDLGQSLTPLPYPREEGQLVQTGAYQWVRHPVYSGLILGALSWATYQVSLSHLLGAIFLCVFLNAKASTEERWLSQKYPGYEDYRQRVKKLIPGVF